MKRTRWITAAAGAFALFGLVAASGPATLAQDATPAADAPTARPVHIHTGNCNNLGEVVVPLTDLVVAQGDTVGQRRATPAYTSYTSVPMALDAILSEDHAINAHLSADEIGTYIACGEIGGVVTPEGQLAIGLLEVENAGFHGVAFLSPGADGASTDVSVFLVETGGNRDRGAGGGEEAAADAGEDAATDMTETTEMEGMEGMGEMDATPAP